MADDDPTRIRPDHLSAYIFGLALVVTSLLYALRAHPELCATARGLTLVMIAVTSIAHLHHRVMRQLDNQQVAAGQLLAEIARARAAMQDGRGTLDEAGEHVRRVEEWIRQVGHDRLSITKLQKQLTDLESTMDRVGCNAEHRQTSSRTRRSRRRGHAGGNDKVSGLDGPAMEAARRISLRIIPSGDDAH